VVWCGFQVVDLNSAPIDNVHCSRKEFADRFRLGFNRFLDARSASDVTPFAFVGLPVDRLAKIQYRAAFWASHGSQNRMLQQLPSAGSLKTGRNSVFQVDRLTIQPGR